jgi:tagaturonate reductase
VVCGEPYHLWAIEGDPIFQRELPFADTDMNVVFTNDLPQYRSRKVKVLNGIHTMSVLLSHLMGVETVRETLENDFLNAFIKQGSMGEIAPTIAMEEKEKLSYIEGVMERFANPFMKHLCLSISLNSVSKFKVRVLPTLLESLALNGEAPKCLCLSLAALIRFYMVTHREAGQAMGRTVFGEYPIQDDVSVVSKMEALWREYEGEPVALTKEVLSHVEFWGQDLSENPSIVEAVSASLKVIMNDGPEQAIKSSLEIS